MYKSLDTLCEKLNIVCKKDEIIAKYTSFKIGGAVSRFIEVENKIQLESLLSLIKKENLDFFILGNGSNLLFSDNSIDLVVIKLVGEFLKIELIDETTVLCGAGVMLSKLCLFAKENSLSGLEFAYGIPGTVGGAVYMNAGAYGGEIKNVVTKSFHFNGENEECFDQENLNFSYRHSAYCDKNYIISEVVIKLKKANQDDIQNTMTTHMNARKDKQPLQFPSAGSTFKRPVGYFAAALIDELGFKGFSVGGAMVSEKHAGFVINTGGATCKDVLSLCEIIKNKTQEEKNVNLELEIKVIGEKTI